MTTRLSPDETGSTMIEIVVVIGLTGLAVSMLLGSLATAVRTSSVHRISAIQSTLVSNAAEMVADSSTPYVTCASVTSYVDALPAGPQSDTTLSIVSVQHWDGNAQAAFTSSCSDDRGIQLLRVRASSQNGTVVEELEFTKRRSSS